MLLIHICCYCHLDAYSFFADKSMSGESTCNRCSLKLMDPNNNTLRSCNIPRSLIHKSQQSCLIRSSHCNFRIFGDYCPPQQQYIYTYLVFTNRVFLHEHARPLNKRFAWRLTTGSAFIKMARLKAIIGIILLFGLGECARDLTKCVPWVPEVTFFSLILMVRGEASSTRREVPRINYEQSPFFLMDSRARETRARVKITPRGVLVAC